MSRWRKEVDAVNRIRRNRIICHISSARRTTPEQCRKSNVDLVQIFSNGILPSNCQTAKGHHSASIAPPVFSSCVSRQDCESVTNQLIGNGFAGSGQQDAQRIYIPQTINFVAWETRVRRQNYQVVSEE
jgi:hypothetical protein